VVGAWSVRGTAPRGASPETPFEPFDPGTCRPRLGSQRAHCLRRCAHWSKQPHMAVVMATGRLVWNAAKPLTQPSPAAVSKQVQLHRYATEAKHTSNSRGPPSRHPRNVSRTISAVLEIRQIDSMEIVLHRVARQRARRGRRPPLLLAPAL
jgi:hypothetical protein